MQAYAHLRPPLIDQCEAARRTLRHPDAAATGLRPNEEYTFDQVLSRLAELVVDRLMAHGEPAAVGQVSDWLDAREAAAHLGIHRDTLRKLAAQRAIPVHQDGPGCKLYFHRDELDEWRRSARPTGSSTTRLRAVA